MRLCYPIMLLVSLAMLAGSAVLLSGCGQKGPLYLPKAEEPAAANKTDKPDTRKKTDQK